MNMYLEAVIDVEAGRWVRSTLIDDRVNFPTLMLDMFEVDQDDFDTIVELYAHKFGLNIENAGQTVHFTESDSSYRIDVQIREEE